MVMTMNEDDTMIGPLLPSDEEIKLIDNIWRQYRMNMMGGISVAAQYVRSYLLRKNEVAWADGYSQAMKDRDEMEAAKMVKETPKKEYPFTPFPFVNPTPIRPWPDRGPDAIDPWDAKKLPRIRFQE